MKGKKLSNEEFKNRAISIHGDKFDLSRVEYIKFDSPVVVGCKKHGFGNVTASNLLKSSSFGCYKCAVECRTMTGGKTRSKNAAIEFSTKAKLIHGERYDYSLVQYLDNTTKITIVCKTHGEFEQSPSDHLSGCGCQECKLDTLKSKFVKTKEEFTALAKEVHGEIYDYSESKYNGMQYPITISCTKHGKFEVLPTNLIHNASGCPKCTHRVSSQEDKLVYDFSDEIILTSDRKIVAPHELDIVFPKHNLAVEVNGRYWHSETCGKDKNYHINKTRKCSNKGITLLHFWDDEIDGKYDIVKSMISSRLGKSKKLHGRKMQIREVENSEAITFTNENHLQGWSVASVKLGLYDDDNLVQIMTFSKPRFSEKTEWEIVRIASKLGITVVGGASKLFNKFMIQYNPSSVLSYADLRYSTGGIYKTLGFEWQHDSAPNYFYVKGAINLPRYKAQKHLLPKLLGNKFNSEKSETQNMLAAGYNKVYDCGNAVYIWRKP